MRFSPLVLLLCAGLSAAQAAKPPAFASLGLPASVTKPLLQGLLQRFVDKGYGKYFRHLGDERDFDHGHLLFDAGGAKPVAVLFHTQELAFEAPAGSPFSFIDPAKRNWLEWMDGRIANASGFVRKDYPKTGGWAWFVGEELPAYRAHHTIVDRMLDSSAVGADTDKSLQWVFTRRECPRAGGAPSPESADIQVTLPGRERVCLELSRS